MLSRKNKTIIGVLALLILVGIGLVYLHWHAATAPSAFSSLTGKAYVYNLVGKNPFDEKDADPYQFLNFSLTFGTSTGNTFSGGWNSDWHNASRLSGCSAGMDPEVSSTCLQGESTDEKNTATVKFDACWGGGSGEARIHYDPKNDTVTWDVTKEPETECFVPDHAVLQRDASQ